MVKQMAAVLMVVAMRSSAALAQNPIQWNGNAQAAIERAREQSLPLMFRVTESSGPRDDDDLRDAQEAAFRDPTVVAIAHKCYVPVRVSRNSKVIAEAEKFGLPTNFGPYIALISPDGKLMAQIDPGVVATPGALATRLGVEYGKYRDAFYVRELKPIITRADAAKSEVRLALQTAWRMGIVGADADVVGLQERPDLTPTEKSRLYTMLAAFGTKPAIEAVLTRAAAGDRDAATALGRAEAGALEWLMADLPAGDGNRPSDRQLAAYRAAALIAKAGSPRPETFWETAVPSEQAKVLEYLKRRAEAVLDYWKESGGRWK